MDIFKETCFLCGAKNDAGAKQYSQKEAFEAWNAGLVKPGIGFSQLGIYFACSSCANIIDRVHYALWKLIGSALVFLVLFTLTWLQISRFFNESYWVIFRVWFIPIPAVLLTIVGMLLAANYFRLTLAAVFKGIRRFNECKLSSLKKQNSK